MFSLGVMTLFFEEPERDPIEDFDEIDEDLSIGDQVPRRGRMIYHVMSCHVMSCVYMCVIYAICF